MNNKKGIKSNILLLILLLGFNVSCSSFYAYEQDRQPDRDVYAHKLSQQDRDAYEQERRQNKDKLEQDSQRNRNEYEKDQQRNRDEHKQNKNRDRTVYEKEYEGVEAEVEEDLFPLSRKLLRENRGRPLDRSSFMITLSTTLPFSLFIDSVTSTSKITTGKHTRKRRMRSHAATWNNPNSMMAKSFTAE